MGLIGYAAMFEQFHPTDLLRWSRLAEELGFGAVMASDHFQPWVPSQGQSAFVWSWLGALGASTRSIRFGTGVTAPGYRYHPAVLAQAAATLAAMFPDRFWLGLGAGEALNEHVVACHWPEAPTRLAILLESVEVIQRLLTGKLVRYRGQHIQMERARLYTLPPTPPPIYLAASGPATAKHAGEVADGLITVGGPDERLHLLLSRFAHGARVAGKDPASMPKIIQLHVSWAPTAREATEQAVREWPNGGMRFPKQDIRDPEDFEAMATLVRPEDFAGRVLISPDLGEHAALVQHAIDLGFTEVYVHNVGRNQEEFLRAYAHKVLPELR